MYTDYSHLILYVRNVSCKTSHAPERTPRRRPLSVRFVNEQESRNFLKVYLNKLTFSFAKPINLGKFSIKIKT